MLGVESTSRNARFTNHYATYRLLRRVAIGLIGGTLTLLGVALLVLPGPAFIVLPVGLAVLGAEFAWARRAIRRIRDAAAGRGR